ncbi:M23 family metallopeptidase [Trichothermofontia sichuanensis B231]|uniref:M23 family metallopeptidase n=1 Tax=Trichothermofontia sichuanensis TaxID=3045816 RepID=UPI002246B602|nr:M23 family metallopeptidase [Trichothermofontia sichuanensis]UZQ54217.1 M23 family metallopeptidase [Trichothermofontia sichuanensis B231]
MTPMTVSSPGSHPVSSPTPCSPWRSGLASLLSVIATLAPLPLLPSLIGVTVAAVLITPSSAVQALQVQVTPNTPSLGDTLSVLIQTPVPASTQPTVQVGNKRYPAFAIAPNRYRAFVPTTPLSRPGPLSLVVSVEGQSQTVSVALAHRDFPTQRIWLPPGKDDLEGTDYEFDRVDAFKQIVSPEKLWSGPFLRPSNGEVTTVYGVRRYYNGEFAQDYYHRGVDYGAAMGSPVVAPAAGRVALVGRESQGFVIHGNTVGIDHGQGVTSILIHLNSIHVREGDRVQAGQVIGTVGSTGVATGAHLHWGLYVHGEAVDPVPWRYQGME